MGFVGKLLSLFTGAARATTPVERPDQRPNLRFTVTITGPSRPSVKVTDDEVASRVQDYAFVLTNELPGLKTSDEWWNDETQKRRLRDNSDKAFEWSAPFVPIDIARLPQLRTSQEWGPHRASEVAKALRSLIRERRKAKQPHDELLKALYGACLMDQLGKTLAFEGVQAYFMTRFVDIREVRGVTLDYHAIGYQCIESLAKTDLKWLIEAFGEPAEHQSPESLWPIIRRNAISRYCWQELRKKNEAHRSLGLPEQSMRQWLDDLVRRNIGYYKEWQERVAASEAKVAESQAVLASALTATRQPFIVGDLETTGLSAQTDEVLELAALRVAPTGNVIEEFSTLIRVAHVPAEIVSLTGITRELLDREAVPLAEGMKKFARFISDAPLFFHNSPFDVAFLKKASEQTGVPLSNRVHDTLPLARQAWPSLRSYKLATLAEHVSGPLPTHRGLSDAKATLAVLLAARKTAAFSARPENADAVVE